MGSAKKVIAVVAAAECLMWQQQTLILTSLEMALFPKVLSQRAIL